MLRKLRVTLVVLTQVVIWVAVTGLAQARETAPGLSDTGRRAFEMIQSRDAAGALELLESVHEKGALNDADRGLLGSIYVNSGRPEAALELLAPLAEAPRASAIILFRAGQASLALGHIESGERYLARSVQRAPDSPAARVLGLRLGARGDMHEAYRLLRPWALSHPKDIEVRFAAAASAIRLQREREADELLEGLPDDDPRVGMLHGQSQLQRGNNEKALTFLEPLLDSAPPYMELDVLRLLADIYVSIGESEKTIALLSEGHRNDARLALLLASAQFTLNEVDAAITTLERFAPDLESEAEIGVIQAQIAFELGRLLVVAGRMEEAIPLLEMMTSLYPQHSPAWKSLGDAFLATGRREQALVARQRFQELSMEANQTRRELAAVSVIDDPVEKTLLKANLAVQNGKGEEALALLRREIEIFPKDIRPRLAETTTLLRIDRKQEALASAQACLGDFASHPDARYQLGAILIALGRNSEAEAQWRETLAVAPSHVAALSDLAVLLIARDEKVEARRLLERVLEWQPENRMAQESLASLEAASGHTEN